MNERETPQGEDLRSEVSLLAGRMRAATTMLGGLLESLEGYIKALEDLGDGRTDRQADTGTQNDVPQGAT